MPIKVRCKHCSTVLTLSDKARGRAVKCRECGGRVVVGKGKRKPRTQAARPADPDNLFGELDLRRAEDRKKKICPNCASPVEDEDVICSRCGVEVETGVLSERERLRRVRKGPPPEEFFGKAWGNAWAFLMANKGWAFRTALVWTMTGTMAICAAFTMRWYVNGREVELRESASGMITVEDDRVFIDLRENPEKGAAVYDGTRYTQSAVGSDNTLTLPGPRMGAMLSPPFLFWTLILTVSILGFGGWAWTLAVKIVGLTLAKEDSVKRFTPDLFGSMTMGFRTVFWPAVTMSPLLPVPLLIYLLMGSTTGAVIALVVIIAIPVLLFLPSALVHLNQKYTYRAWLINWMGQDLAATLIPVLFVSALLVLLVLAVPLTGGILFGVFQEQALEFYETQVEVPALSAGVGYTTDDADTFFSYAFFRLPLLGTIVFLTMMTCCGILAFPAVFMMRVYGLYGLYFRPDLCLINEQPELQAAGFGPRFLAFLIDAVLMTVMAAVAFVANNVVVGLFGALYGVPEEWRFYAGAGLGCITTLLLWSLYFSSWEAGQNRGTLGKASVGLMVLNLEDRPVKAQEALKRAACSFLTCLTLFGGFVMCAFSAEHKALHDILSKTKVVWRGESDEG